MSVSWRDLILAWMHDPPDKALDIPGHVSRAARYAHAACDDTVTANDLRQIGTSDMLASATERLPMPKGDDPSRQVGPDDGFSLFHPLSNEKRVLDGSMKIDEAFVERHIRQIVDQLPGQEKPHRFLALWRLLAERLEGERADLAWLPADTRTPDHTIWQHNDVTAALSAVDWGDNAAFLSFSISPVQPFIASARSVRDLWTGSMILSWLAFQAMLPIIEALGPTALVYPALRGVPFVDLWLSRKLSIDARELNHPIDAIKSPCLPNQFVAVVPWGPQGNEARVLAKCCGESARREWKRLCDAVRAVLRKKIEDCVDESLRSDWDRYWDRQVEDFFDFRTALLPWRESDITTLARLLRGTRDLERAFPHAARVRALAEIIPPNERPGHSWRPEETTAGPWQPGQWQYRLELSARLMEAEKSIRHLHQSTPAREGEQVPPKCALMGTFEQMGPANLEQSARFWNQVAANVKIDGVRLRPRERLCAVALVKRFAGPAFLKDELGIKNPQDLRWHDTATIAASAWLERAKEIVDRRRIRAELDEWSGQWLHWPSTNADKDDVCPPEVFERIQAARRQFGKPPSYFAVLMVDGDGLGGWLRGDHSPSVRDVMHEKLLKYYKGLPAEEILDARRPVGPALHAAISQALANFALRFVPEIIKKHLGTLIYAGGDDVLALLPTASALACARELSAAFGKGWKADRTGRQRLLMGHRATLSAGLAVVHYKEDLRLALQIARDAQSAAKARGRDALQLSVCRRSGEHATAICPWKFAPTLEDWVNAFLEKGKVPGASDRWAFHLRAEVETLAGLPPEAMRAEIRRQVGRAEQPTRTRLSRDGASPENAAAEIVEAFDTYRACRCPDGTDGATGGSRFNGDGDALKQFVTLCQSASFLARGRDA
ncbi:MAG TPA: type III-B CRISPR-associated protein Cas10/Cmr2 [Pirellulales bacterium]|nr:type III-B CRISPR-associated protein Cas10/Cmr2 [Pirellulales bacterium]